MPYLPGELLNKRYRIVGLLGSGQYGAVYRAYDVIDRSDVALKEYRDPSLETQRLFRAEARRLSRLSHPQLPAVLDHFAVDQVGQFLVSSYVDGVDLQTLIDDYGPLPSDLIIGWLQSACRPLAYLHAQNVLHLNVKPANLRVTPAGDLFLVDTGLPGLGIRPHTPGYGAPEQQARAEVGPTADIYSLGATLHTLLTGQVPPNALARESGLQDLVPAREINPDVEPYLSIVAARAMSLRADARYDTAEAFGTALNRPPGRPAPQPAALRRAPDPVTAVPPPPRIPPSRRRQMERRTIIGLLGLLAIIIIAAVGVGVLNIGGPPELTEAEATATLESAVIAALTQIAPTATPTPEPTALPTATPEPFITETGSRMILIPGGVFRMGDDASEEANQRPSHLIRLDPYYIDETEVTNGEYKQCVDAGVCAAPASRNASYHPAYFGDSDFDDYPVIFVSWFDAETFCGWRGARLPTEAEWEKAAGFEPVETLKFRYPWGDEFDGTRLNFCDANCPRDFADVSVDDGHRDTAPVGSYANGRSPGGIYDMAGNVTEWVADWFDARYYETSSDTNPLGPLDGVTRVMRGGSWLSPAESVQTTYRDSFDPAVARANIGFRCAMTPP